MEKSGINPKIQQNRKVFLAEISVTNSKLCTGAKIKFCTVRAICNLVLEFNGLVSTGDWFLPNPYFFGENTSGIPC